MKPGTRVRGITGAFRLLEGTVLASLYSVEAGYDITDTWAIPVHWDDLGDRFAYAHELEEVMEGE